MADDSLVYRSQIKEALGKMPGVEVVGASSNGRLAIEKLQQSQVDLLILDLEMPEMDGLETLYEMARQGLECKVLMFASVSKRGADITLEALRMGATDFMTKPGPSADSSPSEKIREILEPKLHALFPVFQKMPNLEVKNSKYPEVNWELFYPKIVVIGSSTGGPGVLESLFSQLRGPLTCPILITQHMPPLFTEALAQRLQKLCGIRCIEAIDGIPIEANSVYLAPGDFHMCVAGTRNNPKIALNQGEQRNHVRPAVDPLFETAAEMFGNDCLGIVLTGMGADGRAGAEAIKQLGGAVIIQEKESCVVFGMPKAVMDSGAYDKIQTPTQILQTLRAKAVFSENNLKATGGE